jgi:hypothetical protein
VSVDQLAQEGLLVSLPAEAEQKSENATVPPAWSQLWEWLLSPDDERDDSEEDRQGAA